MDKKIFAACLSTKTPIIAIAGWRNQILHISEVQTLKPVRTELDKVIIPQLADYERRGFDVLIDEVSPRLSRSYGRLARLCDIDHVTGKPVLVAALRAYGELRNYRAITYPGGATSRYEIPDSLVDEERDLNGQTKYLIDWDALKPECAAILLCAYSATSPTVSHGLYMRTLLKELSGESANSEAQSRFQAATLGYDQAIAESFPSVADKAGGL